MKQILIILAVIFILGMASPTITKLDVIIANQEQILQEIRVNQAYLKRIEALVAPYRESLAAEQF